MELGSANLFFLGMERFPAVMKNAFVGLCQRRLKETIKAAGDFEPNVIVTIDSKGFCFRLLQGVQGWYQSGFSVASLLTAVHKLL